MINTVKKRIMPSEEHIDDNEETEEQSERYRIMFMALILCLLFPVLFGGMHFMYKLIEKSRPVFSPLFSSISECVEYGGNITGCTQAWDNALPSLYRLPKHSPSMLKNKNNYHEVVNSCNLGLFTNKMILAANIGNIYQLENEKKAGDSCVDILSNTRALLKIPPYRDVSKIENSLKNNIAELWLDIGLRLYQSNQKMKAIQVWEFIAENFSGSTDASLHNKIAEAWFNIGIIYYELGRPELSSFYWEKIVDRYAKSSNPAIIVMVSKAAVNMGQVSLLLNKNSTFRIISNQ